MIEIIDKLYENSLLEDMEHVNTEGEDVFSEIEKQDNKELLALFNKLSDNMCKNGSFILV